MKKSNLMISLTKKTNNEISQINVIRDRFLNMTKKALLNITGVKYNNLSELEKEVLNDIIKDFSELDHLTWLAEKKSL